VNPLILNKILRNVQNYLENNNSNGRHQDLKENQEL
jgi:hypothetical protein